MIEVNKTLEQKIDKALKMQGKTYVMEVSHKAISIDEENKTAVFILSTGLIDRHGDMVDQETWNLEHFEKNPSFFFQHNSWDFPLGKWLRLWFEDDPEMGKVLVGEAKFSVDIDETSKRAWEHVKEGNLKMVSVGFIPHRVEYDEEKDCYKLYDNELLEASLVGIGSNRQALIKDIQPRTKQDEVINNLISAKNSINERIEKEYTKIKVISALKVRDDINKAIRRAKNITK